MAENKRFWSATFKHSCRARDVRARRCAIHRRARLPTAALSGDWPGDASAALALGFRSAGARRAHAASARSRWLLSGPIGSSSITRRSASHVSSRRPVRPRVASAPGLGWSKSRSRHPASVCCTNATASGAAAPRSMNRCTSWRPLRLDCPFAPTYLPRERPWNWSEFGPLRHLMSLAEWKDPSTAKRRDLTGLVSGGRGGAKATVGARQRSHGYPPDLPPPPERESDFVHSHGLMRFRAVSYPLRRVGGKDPGLFRSAWGSLGRV